MLGEKTEKNKRIFYGWIVCAVGLLLIFVTMGTVSNGFSVFMPFIIKEHGLTNAQTSSLVTLRCVVSFFSMLLIGKYYEKVGYRLGTTIAALCACVTYCIYSVATTYPVFCAGAAISGLSYGLGSMIPISIIMNRWFIKHKALTIGICGTGSGVATVVLPPVCTWMIEKFSMVTAFRVLAIVIFCIAVIIFALLRGKPEDKGLVALGAERDSEIYEGINAEINAESDSETKNNTNSNAESSVVSYSLSKKGWIYTGIICLAMGAVANPGFVHLSVLFTSEGFSSMTVAAAISVAGVLIAVSKIICGQFTDRVGGKKSSIVFATILLIGHILCCMTFLKSEPLCIITVIVLGLGYPLATIGPSIWAADMASQEHFPKTVRRFQIIYAGGALIFASVPGIMADFFGNYISAYIMFSALLVLTLVLIVLSYRESARCRKEQLGRKKQEQL